MKMFLSRHRTKVDTKGRVSIPSLYRGVVKDRGNMILYAYPSFVNKCVEVCTADIMSKLYAYVEQLSIFSPERIALSTALFSGSEELSIDTKGRVGLTSDLLSFAEIKGEAVFAGKGDRFEIWSPSGFDQHFSKAREAARMFVEQKGIEHSTDKRKSY